MDSNWRSPVLATVAGVVLLLLTAGCGGFSADQPVSPATFLLPGLGKVAPGSQTIKPSVLPASGAPMVAATR